MMVLKTILFILLIIIIVIVILLLILLFTPFTYRLELCNEDDKCYGFRFDYIIIKLSGEVTFSPKFSFKVKNWNKVLVDSSKKKDKPKEKDSIEDTGFIKNRGLEKEITNSKRDIKKIFDSAKISISKKKEIIDAKKIDKAVETKKAHRTVDSFKNLLPSDFIYVLKRFITEGLKVIEKIRPKSCAIDIKYNANNSFENGLKLAIAAPFYAIMGDRLKVGLAKNKNYYKLIFKGRPVLIGLCKPILNLLLDKKVRRFIFKKK